MKKSKKEEERKDHHLTETDMRVLSVAYDVLLFFGALIIVFGYIESSYLMIFMGIAIVSLTILFLELLWRAKHHINRKRKERKKEFWI